MGVHWHQVWFGYEMSPEGSCVKVLFPTWWCSWKVSGSWGFNLISGLIHWWVHSCLDYSEAGPRSRPLGVWLRRVYVPLCRFVSLLLSCHELSSSALLHPPYHGFSLVSSPQQWSQNRPWTETMSQNKSFLPLSCFGQIFCHKKERVLIQSKYFFLWVSHLFQSDGHWGWSHQEVSRCLHIFHRWSGKAHLMHGLWGQEWMSTLLIGYDIGLYLFFDCAWLDCARYRN
jgi:hypothetical protein